MQAVSIDTRESLGEGSFLGWLVERRALTPVMAGCVARVQAETSGRLVAILLTVGLLSESYLADALASYCRLPRWVPEALPSEAPNFPFINRSFLLAYQIVPLRVGAATVELACWDALDDYPPAAVKFAVGRGVSRCVGTRTEITTALGNLYGPGFGDEGTAITADDVIESAELAQLRKTPWSRGPGSWSVNGGPDHGYGQFRDVLRPQNLSRRRAPK